MHLKLAVISPEDFRLNADVASNTIHQSLSGLRAAESQGFGAKGELELAEHPRPCEGAGGL